MKNTWVNTRNMNDRIEQENQILQSLYQDNFLYIEDKQKFENHIQKIVQAMIGEIWTEDSFNHSEDYRQHMMYCKNALEIVVPKQVCDKVRKNYKEGNLFNFIALAALEKIEIFNKFYTDIFYGEVMIGDMPMKISCGCKVCS